jgi:hypothetical protein
MLQEIVAATGETFCAYSVTIQEHSIAYCRFGEAVKMLSLMLSPNRTIDTLCGSVLHSDDKDGGRLRYY